MQTMVSRAPAEAEPAMTPMPPRTAVSGPPGGSRKGPAAKAKLAGQPEKHMAEKGGALLPDAYRGREQAFGEIGKWLRWSHAVLSRPAVAGQAVRGSALALTFRQLMNFNYCKASLPAFCHTPRCHGSIPFK